MIKLGWLAREALVQTWERERYRKNVPFKGEVIEKLKQKFGDIDPATFPISVGSVCDAVYGEAGLEKQVDKRHLYRAFDVLIKKGLLIWSEPIPGKGGVKLTERGRKVAQLLWLQREERNLLEQAIRELKGKGYRFATTEQLLNQIWEAAKVHDVDEKVFREYWSKRRVGLLMKKLGIRQKQFIIKKYDFNSMPSVTLPRLKPVGFSRSAKAFRI